MKKVRISLGESSKEINLEKKLLNGRDIPSTRRMIISKIKTFLESIGEVCVDGVRQKNDSTMLLLNVPSLTMYEIIYEIVKIYLNEANQLPKEFYNDKLDIVIHFEERAIINQDINNGSGMGNCNKIIDKSKKN